MKIILTCPIDTLGMGTSETSSSTSGPPNDDTRIAFIASKLETVRDLSIPSRRKQTPPERRRTFSNSVQHFQNNRSSLRPRFGTFSAPGLWGHRLGLGFGDGFGTSYLASRALWLVKNPCLSKFITYLYASARSADWLFFYEKEMDDT